MVNYIPQQGDIVALSFDPQSGHEQKEKRPAVIISNQIFNKHLRLAFACPITNTKRDSPFHIKCNSKNISGYIISEQMKSIDYNSQNILIVLSSRNLLEDSSSIYILKASIVCMSKDIKELFYLLFRNCHSCFKYIPFYIF